MCFSDFVMSVNDTIFKAAHCDGYSEGGEPKNQSNTSEVPPLFILPEWRQLHKKKKPNPQEKSLF